MALSEVVDPMRRHPGTLSVLVVDDDTYVRATVSRMLAAVGVKDVRQAASATVALDIAAEPGRPLHLVIADLAMPDVDGMEFLRRLSEQRADIGVLIVSGQDDAILRSVETMAREYGLPVLGVLPKPLSCQALREKLAAFPHRAPWREGPAGAVSVDEIRDGLARDEFQLVYQPKIDLASGAPRGAEALVRWRHPTRGELAPDRFITAVERFGFMEQLSLHSLDAAARQMRDWAAAGCETPVSLNVSLSCVADTAFGGRVIETLARHAVPPKWLTIEVTETMAMTDTARSLETLVRLRMHGVGLSVDDFGIGHSGLQQISRVPFTELKIDRAFVTGAAAHPRLRAIVESSIGIARRLGLTSVAEGIESAEDLAVLLDLGCDVGQGFFIARPMPAASLTAWLRAAQCRGPRG